MSGKYNIYKTTDRKGKYSYDYWVFNCPEIKDATGKVIRKAKLSRRYKTKREAQEAVQELKEHDKNFGTLTITLSNKQKADSINALTILADITLEQKTPTLTQAATFLVEKHGHIGSPQLLSQYLDDVIETHEGTAGYVKELGRKANALLEFYEKKSKKNIRLSEIKTKDLDEFVESRMWRGKPLKNNSKIRYRDYLSGLFKKANKKKLVIDDLISSMDEIKKDKITIVYFRVGEFREIISKIDDLDYLVAFIIMAFTGLRLSEYRRLKYHHIHWAKNPDHKSQIKVNSDVGKKNEFRVRTVDIQPNLEKWLLTLGFDKKNGYICPFPQTDQNNDSAKSAWDSYDQRLRKKYKITKWDRNILVHTYGCHCYEHNKRHGGLDYVRQQMGHTSVDTTSKHYATSDVLEVEAIEFWSIEPSKELLKSSEKAPKLKRA